jgi:hypothetical protein
MQIASGSILLMLLVLLRLLSALLVKALSMVALNKTRLAIVAVGVGE